MTSTASAKTGARLHWKVHTYGLLREILTNTGTGILRVPLGIFGQLLFAVGERAAELNDPQLNALMVRLAIYTCADPESPDFDQALCKRVLAEVFKEWGKSPVFSIA